MTWPAIGMLARWVCPERSLSTAHGVAYFKGYNHVGEIVSVVERNGRRYVTGLRTRDGVVDPSIDHHRIEPVGGSFCDERERCKCGDTHRCYLEAGHDGEHESRALKYKRTPAAIGHPR